MAVNHEQGERHDPFHPNCLEKWVRKNPVCPLDRLPLNPDYFDPVVYKVMKLWGRTKAGHVFLSASFSGLTALGVAFSGTRIGFVFNLVFLGDQLKKSESLQRQTQLIVSLLLQLKTLFGRETGHLGYEAASVLGLIGAGTYLSLDGRSLLDMKVLYSLYFLLTTGHSLPLLIPDHFVAEAYSVFLPIQMIAGASLASIAGPLWNGEMSLYSGGLNVSLLCAGAAGCMAWVAGGADFPTVAAVSALAAASFGALHSYFSR